jgi:hypothetical protein
MAGKRRQGDAPPKPLQRVSRHGRRRAAVDVNLATAVNLRDRWAVASDYLRAAIATCNPDPEQVERLIQDLIARADALYLKEGANR